MKHKKITETERFLLAEWKKGGLSNRECARRLHRNVATIGRELKRNKTRVAVGRNDWEIIYEPTHAQHISEERKQNAWLAKEPLKNTKIYAYVLERLGWGWSPEQIAGRLKYVEHIPLIHHGTFVMKRFMHLSTKKKQMQQKKGYTNRVLWING